MRTETNRRNGTDLSSGIFWAATYDASNTFIAEASGVRCGSWSASVYYVAHAARTNQHFRNFDVSA
jgi:hypothetical protein